MYISHEVDKQNSPLCTILWLT